jgi:hypothetical protein
MKTDRKQKLRMCAGFLDEQRKRLIEWRVIMLEIENID